MKIDGTERADSGRCHRSDPHSHWWEGIRGGVHCAACGRFVRKAWVRCHDRRATCEDCGPDSDGSKGEG